MPAVPFELAKVMHGFLSCKGLLHDGGDHLAIEFECRDAILGAYRSGVRRVRVPLKEITAVSFRQPWLGKWATIEIRTDSLAPLADVPTASQGKLTLHVPRADTSVARQFFDGLHVSVTPA